MDYRNNKFSILKCINCGLLGHVQKNCSMPTTSYGILAYKIVTQPSDEENDKNSSFEDIVNPSHRIGFELYPKIKFLMVQRKDTMAYTDIIRGRYPDDHCQRESTLKTYISEMTVTEREKLRTKTFVSLWDDLWMDKRSRVYTYCFNTAKLKYDRVDIQGLLKSAEPAKYTYTELSFPKGRRMAGETDLDCAVREFYEETGFQRSEYTFVSETATLSERFIGTNGIEYLHIYYIVHLPGDTPIKQLDTSRMSQIEEVSNLAWLTYTECLHGIRPYDKAKIRTLKTLYDTLITKDS